MTFIEYDLVLQYDMFVYLSAPFSPSFSTLPDTFFFTTSCTNQSQEEINLVYNNFKVILDEHIDNCQRQPLISNIQVNNTCKINDATTYYL